MILGRGVRAKTSTLCSGLIVLLFAPALAQSQVVNLTGKITACVAPQDVPTVTDDKGGWFESRPATFVLL